VKRLVKVGAATLLPFIVTFLPFLLAGLQQLPQILSRLFPFQRGLIHDYWAPNFWALYYFADKVANLVAARLGGRSIGFEAASELHHLRVLPQVSPAVTNIIVLLVTLPLLIRMVRHRIAAPRLVFLCGAVFFLFGFHVH
jgi:alpha-1,3-glucosyltransferase